MGCPTCTQPKIAPQTVEELMQNKQVVAWAAWFVSIDDPLNPQLLRYDSAHNIGADLPEDGFLCAKTRFADGTGENIGGNGWIVFQETSAGLIFQATGDNIRPDPARYPAAKFIKDKLCPSALLHVAFEEAAQWQ